MNMTISSQPFDEACTRSQADARIADRTALQHSN